MMDAAGRLSRGFQALISGGPGPPQGDPSLLAPSVDQEDLAAFVAGVAAAEQSVQWDGKLQLDDGRSRWLSLASWPDPVDGTTASARAGAGELSRAVATARWNLDHDGLTGLPSRTLFIERLAEALEHAREHDESVGVCFIDLDHYKQVNDTLGHAGGDQVLRMLATSVAAALRPQDTVARHGSDELKVLLPGLPSRELAVELAGRLSSACAEPVYLDLRRVVVRCSVGVAVAPEDGLDGELLLSRAESAMQRAKQLGRGRVVTFDRDLARRSEERTELELRLRATVDNGEFHLVYQPQADAYGEQASVEALLRWHPRDHVPIPPGEFIPLAEELGLIGAIGAWVLREACFASAAWNLDGAPQRVCVNLSPNQLADPNLAALVAETLAASGLPAHLLELELTETALMEVGEAASSRLAELRALGVRVSLDDFGTGYSSLARLQHLELDALKIDRSFIAEIGEGCGTAIVGTIIELGHTLGLEVVAEGIETAEQHRVVKLLGVDLMQGYLIGRPAAERTRPLVHGRG